VSLGFIQEPLICKFQPTEGRTLLIAAENSLSTASLRLLPRGGSGSGGVVEACGREAEDKRDETIQCVLLL